MEDEIKNDQELYSYFRGRNATLCRDNFTFLMEHPEVKRLLNDYLSNILLHKPDDVFKFTKDYFKFLSDKGDSDHFVVLVGPNSVGKSTLIDRIMQEIPNVFEKPKFTSSKEKENCNVVSKEDFMDLLNNHEVLAYTYDNKEKEYEGITKGEIKRIIDEGKIALLEIDLAGALKINSTSVGANFIGILPPSLDELRMRIKAHTKLNTGNINKVLEKSKEEIKEIENHSFFTFRIMNDQLERGYLDFKNAIISLFPFLKYTPEDIEQVRNIPSRVEEEKKDEKDDKLAQMINEIQELKKEGDDDNKSIKSNNKSVKSENKSIKSDNKSVKSGKSIKNDNQSVKSENKSEKKENQSVKSEKKSVKDDNQSVKSEKEEVKTISREKSLKSVKSIKSNKSILNESKHSEKDKNKTQSDFGRKSKSKIEIPEDNEILQKEEEIKENEQQEKKEESVHNDIPQEEQNEVNAQNEVQQEEIKQEINEKNVDEPKKEEDNKEESQKEVNIEEEKNEEINKETSQEVVNEEIKENIIEKEVLSQKEESVNKSDK